MKTDLDGIAQDVSAIKTSLQNQKNDSLVLKDTSVDFSGDYAQNKAFGDTLNYYGAQLDSIKAAGMGANWGDSGAWNDGSNFGISSGSIGDAKNQLTGYVNGLSDTGAIGQFNDSLNGWIKKFDYSQLKGSGCPVALTRTTDVSIPLAGNSVTFTMPAFGKYICEPIFGDITGWNFCTTALRFIVVFGCFIWLFKVATGQDGGGSDDD